MRYQQLEGRIGGYGSRLMVIGLVLAIAAAFQRRAGAAPHRKG